MAGKKLSKKSCSRSATKGKQAVQKGVKFEDTVADLYRLLGVDVVQNIEICQKKVDILATFSLPGSPTGHRVIVECKDEKKAVAQNQRVMQFKGLLATARSSGYADSAEIITRVNWSDQAKGFARESGVVLLTYAQKMAQLIDFTMYLRDMVNRFEKRDPRRRSEPPLAKYYVDLSAERITERRTKPIPVIDNYIHRWMQRNNTEQHLAILGEYGTGKTSFCQKLAHDLAASYLKEPGSCRIPILINLREFTKTLKIESLINSFLDEECGVTNPRYRLFQAMNEAGLLVLIFDGFDEMAVRVDADTLEINLQEIDKLAACPKSKVIITSRIEYFVSREEERKALRPKGMLLATRETEYEPLKIRAWDENQVDSFLEKRVPLIREAKETWTYYRDRIRDIPGLSDLSRRPVLLEMIVKTLPRLIASEKPINRPSLYETYLLGEIKRQAVMKARRLLLSESARFSLLQRLALDFYVREKSAIIFGDALKHIEQLLKPPRSELEAYTRDFLTCSFLIRKDDEYVFSHRSISEYLTAKALVAEIEMDAPDAFGRRTLDRVVTQFLAELDPNKDTLWSWIQSTKSRAGEELKYLGGNAATLLCTLDRDALAGRDLSGTVLTRADLCLANLREGNFDGTIMNSVSLINAEFSAEDLASAKLRDVTVSLYVLGRFIGRGKRAKPSYKRRDPYAGVRDTMRALEAQLGALGAAISQSTWISYGVLDAAPEDGFLTMVIVRIPDATCLQLLQSKVCSESYVQASSLYAHEHATLIKMLPKQVVPNLRSLLRAAGPPFYEE